MRRGQERTGGGRGRTDGTTAPDRNKSGSGSSVTESRNDTASIEPGVDNREKVYSWFDIIRAGAQLTLDVLRVIRESSDLYRKLSSGK